MDPGSSQRLLQVPDQVVDGLDPDREPHRSWFDPGGGELVVRQLPVRRRRWMDHERLRVADVRKMAPDAERLDETTRLVAAALEVDREDRPSAARQVALREPVERRRRQSGVTDAR